MMPKGKKIENRKKKQEKRKKGGERGKRDRTKKSKKIACTVVKNNARPNVV